MRASSRQQNFALIRSDHESLPDEVFAYALADYLRRRPSQTQTVTLEDLAFGEGAPGRAFCLDEPGLLGRLDRLEAVTDSGVVFDETAGLKQIYVHQVPDPVTLLQQYYESRAAETRNRWSQARVRRAS